MPVGWQDYAGLQAKPQRTPVQSVFQQGWPQGWQPDLERTNIPSTSVADLLNVVWNPDFTLSKRGGYRQIADDTITDLGNAEFLLASRVYTADGLFPQYTQLVAHFNDSDGELFFKTLGLLWEEFLDPGNGEDFETANESMGSSTDTVVNRFRTWPINMVTYEEKIYFFSLRFGGWDENTTLANPTSGDWQTTNGDQDGQSLPIVFDADANTWSRPAVADLEAGVTSGFPQARTGLAKYARMFVGNSYKQGTFRYPSRINWSGTDLDPTLITTWDKDNYIEVGADDGQEIIRMLSFGDQILILKNQSVWTLVGTDDTTFALYQLDDKLGTEGTYAATSTKGMAWFLDEREGVMQFDGANFENISEPIKDKLLDELNRSFAYKNVVQWHDDMLYVSICAGTSKVQNVTYVYDTRLKVWTRWDYGMLPTPFPMYTDLEVTGDTVALSRNLFGGVAADKGLFEFNTGLNDVGDAISCYVTTPWIKFVESLGSRYRLRRVDLLADETDAAITIEVYKDLEADTTEKSFTYNPATGTQNALDQTAIVDDFTFQFLALKFIQNGDDEDMNLRGWGVSLSERPSPRGRKSETGYGAA